MYRPRIKTLALAVGLSLAGGSAAHAAVDPEKLLQAYETLLHRVEQLEAANKKLETALQLADPEHIGEMSERVEDMEGQMRALKQPRPLDNALDGVTVGGALTMVGQSAMRGSTPGSDDQLNYRVDIEVEIPGDSLGKLAGFSDSLFFAHFRAGQGVGLNALNPTLTGTLNSSSFELATRDDSAAILAQAWYRVGMPVGGANGGPLGRFEATLGKIDMFGMFDGNDLADDESEAFLNNVFVHNPLLDSGGALGADSYGFAPGAVLAYVNDINSVNHWRFSLGAFGSGPGASFENSFSQPFVIAQAEYTGRVLRGQPGTWRAYAWNNPRAIPYANEFDTATERHSGFGLSVDQQITPRGLSLFARYGQSLDGRVKFDRAFTVGGVFNGYRWGRQNDRIGLAAGWLSPSSEFERDAPTLDADTDGNADFGFAPRSAEKQFELFYAWQVNDSLQLTPGLQWVLQPGGDDTLEDIAVFSLRAKAAF